MNIASTGMQQQIYEYYDSMLQQTSISPLAHKSATQAVLDMIGQKTKYKLGQNFLINEHIIERITHLAGLHDKSFLEHESISCIEVGPGLGTLTLALIKSGLNVIAIEADSTLEPIHRALEQLIPQYKVIFSDATKLSPQEIMAAIPPYAPLKYLIANLPYAVAATLILQYFETLPDIHDMCVMVQAEVAQRISAVPRSKIYGAYTAKLAQFAYVTGHFNVGPQNFYPAPRVESTVIRLTRRANSLYAQKSLSYPQVARIIDSSFAQRRKTLKNNLLLQGYSSQRIEYAFKEMNVEPTIRAEVLSPEDFVSLTCLLTNS